jgi:hypothetical protein
MFKMCHPPNIRTSPDEKEAMATMPKIREVVQRLNFLLFLGPIRMGNERRRADEAEVPADPKKDQRQPEMPDRCAG